MRTVSLLLFCWGILSFIACEREKKLTFEIPFEGEKLVVYGYLNEDGTSEIEVYKSQPVGDDFINSPLPFSEIKAQLLSLNGDSVPYYFDKNKGKCLLTGSLGADYTLAVQADGLSVTSSTVSLPTKVKIDSVLYTFSLDSANISMRIFFTPPTGITGYYAMGVDKIISDSIVESMDFKAVVVSTDNVLSPYELDRKIYRRDADKFVVKFYSLSHHVYDFYESVRQNSGEFGSHISDKTPLWTNIIGGYGFFATATADTVVIQL